MALPLPKVEQERVRRIVSGTKGKFFRVHFVKRTSGEERIMDCRIGVHKFVKGVGMKFTPKDYDLISVWDLRAWDPKGDTGYRFINIRTVKEIHFAKRVYTFG